MRALYASERKKETLKGEGIWDTFRNAYNQIADSDSKLWNYVKNAHTIGDLDSAFWAQTGYPAAVERYLNQHGHTKITSLKVRRAPIQAGIDAAFGILSKGKWFSSKKKFGYDNMFHLSLIANDSYVLEKLDRINIAPMSSVPNAEFMDVPLVAEKGLTLDEVLANTRKAMEGRFFNYDPFKNNCQVFILNILESNGMLTEPLRAFILQPVD